MAQYKTVDACSNGTSYIVRHHLNRLFQAFLTCQEIVLNHLKCNPRRVSANQSLLLNQAPVSSTSGRRSAGRIGCRSPLSFKVPSRMSVAVENEIGLAHA